MTDKFQNKKGFTLVELLVVIAVIAILASVIAPNAFSAMEKAKVARAISDLKTFNRAALLFYADMGFFPGDPSGSGGTNPEAANLESSVYGDPGFYYKRTTGFNNNSLTSQGLTVGAGGSYAQQVEAKWNGPYIDKPFINKSPWGSQYDYECWVAGVGVGAPYDHYLNGTGLFAGQDNRGIYITIHGIPPEAAKRISEESPFPLALTRDGQAYGPDDVAFYRDKGLYKVVMRIAKP